MGRDSTLRPSSCMSASLVSLFSVFFLSSTILEARKVALDPSQLILEPMAAMSTLSGFPRPTFALLDQGRQAYDRGKLRIQLVLTPTRDNGEVKSDPVNKDSDLQQAQTVYEYLSVNGHEIWISDFILSGSSSAREPLVWVHLQDVFMFQPD